MTFFVNFQYVRTKFQSFFIIYLFRGIVHINKHLFAHFSLSVIFLPEIMFCAKSLSVINFSFSA